MTPTIDIIEQGYWSCALWSSTFSELVGEDEMTVPMDRDYDLDDIHPATRAEHLVDLKEFVLDNLEDLVTAAMILADYTMSWVGHDFWLTRNHHGAGFWDRGLGPVGRRLYGAAHVYGGVDLYIDDEGKVRSE